MESINNCTSLELVELLNFQGEHKSKGLFGDVFTPEGKLITRDQLITMAYEYAQDITEGNYEE